MNTISAGDTSFKTSAYGIISHRLSGMAIASKLPVVDMKLDRTQCTGRRNFMRHYNFLDKFLLFLFIFFL